MNSSSTYGVQPRLQTNAPPPLAGLRHTMLSSETLERIRVADLVCEMWSVWEALPAPDPESLYRLTTGEVGQLREISDRTTREILRPRPLSELTGLDALWMRSLMFFQLQRLRASTLEPRHLELRRRQQPHGPKPSTSPSLEASSPTSGELPAQKAALPQTLPQSLGRSRSCLTAATTRAARDFPEL